MVPDRSHVLTEHRNPASERLDELPIVDAVRLMNQQDAAMVAAVGEQAAAIARAVELVAAAFKAGGRLVYFGAGTSGRLGVMDASECPPTFFTDPAMVVGVIAGGDKALTRSIEAVEDDRAAGAAEVERLGLSAKDVAFGIAAGGTTPFVHAALESAKAKGAATVFLSCTKREHIKCDADVFICVETGPEVLTGSTRLKAGTATKLVLNTVTTLAMVQIGKTFGNLMVDVDALKNAKLVDRGVRILGTLTGLGREEAMALLQRAEGKVKRAVVMARRGCGADEADRLLAAAGGRLRVVLGS